MCLVYAARQGNMYPTCKVIDTDIVFGVHYSGGSVHIIDIEVR